MVNIYTCHKRKSDAHNIYEMCFNCQKMEKAVNCIISHYIAHCLECTEYTQWIKRCHKTILDARLTLEISVYVTFTMQSDGLTAVLRNVCSTTYKALGPCTCLFGASTTNNGRSSATCRRPHCTTLFIILCCAVSVLCRLDDAFMQAAQDDITASQYSWLAVMSCAETAN